MQKYIITCCFILSITALLKVKIKKKYCIQFLDYKLVIICSSENEYKSPMISALDKYRAPKIAVAGVEKIKEYLKKKYTPENVFDSAADVDSIG